MANFQEYLPHLLKFEGGWSDNKLDKGGATNLGVTLAVWIKKGYDKDKDGDIDKADLKLITPEDAGVIAKKYYWDPVKGDEINSQSVAEFIADWAYNSGTQTAIKKTQRLLGLVDDGVLGPKTLAAINSADPKTLFNKLKASRLAFVRSIVEYSPKQSVFLKGWENRINSFTFNG